MRGRRIEQKAKWNVPAHPHPLQCAHWSTFPLEGGRSREEGEPQTFPLPGGRWPEGPDEGALQVWFGASSRRAPHDRVVPCRHGHAALLKNARCPGRAAERPGHQAVGMEEGTIPEKGGTQLLGGMTVAMPLMTTSPFWLVQTVSSLTMFFSAMISLTVAVAVTVSPKRTGLVNLSSWPR